MQKDSEDNAFRLKLSQYVVHWLESENKLVVIRGQKIYRSRVKYSELEASDEYTDSFRLTSVKMEEILSMTGLYFAPGNQLK
jgi:hypothetical protein